MSNNKLPEGMPPVPEGAKLDGQLRDHDELAGMLLELTNKEEGK